jgi:hypothetical protein
MMDLNDQIKQESNNKVGLRGLEPGTECQVFRIYFTPAIAETFDCDLRGVREMITSQALVAARKANERTNQRVEAMRAYVPINIKLKKYLERNAPERYAIRQPTGSESWLGWAPPLQNESVFLPMSDSSFHEFFLSGI